MNLSPARLVFACALALVLTPPLSAAEPLPVEAFAALPRITFASLSPDGSHFAAVVHEGDATLVLTRPLKGDEPPKIVLRNDEPGVRVRWARFVREDRLLVSVGYSERRTGQWSQWPAIGESRLIAVDRDGSHLKVLMEPRGWQRGRIAQFQDDVVDWLPGDGHHVLLALQAEARDPARALWRVDVDSGERSIVRNPPSHLMRWFTDARHQPRASLAQDGTEVTIQVCDADGSHWRDAWRYRLSDADSEGVVPLGFGDDPDRLFVEAGRDGQRSVYEVDLRDPALPRRQVLEGRQGRLLVDAVTHRALGVAGSRFEPTGEAHAADRFWDADAKKLVAAIDAALPGQANRLEQFSDDGSRYLLFTSGNGVPGRFMVGDRASGELTELGAQYPRLPPAQLARKARFSLPAHDGARLAAFLALPKGDVDKSLPAVVVPMGAPVGQDTLDFDAWVDFLADRGYAVLQVASRTKVTAGPAFMKAGMQRVEPDPQDDLADAVRWLVDRGTADRSRICVMGGGFGGYAALMGGAKTPGLYRCVVAVAGVSDLVELGNTRRDFFNGREVYEALVGSPWKDRERLGDASPARMAASFQAPVLLLHGTADTQIPYAQSDEMAAALSSAGKQVRLVKQPDGDHALNHAAHRLEAFREVDAFLAAHLAPTRSADSMQARP